MFGKTNNSMIRFIKPILKFFVKSNAIKSLVISLLEDYSASTETDIDDELINQFDHDNPANSVRTLLELRSMISKLNDDFWKEKKMTQIDEVLRQCLGLFAEVSTLSSSKTKGDTCSFNIEIINRSTEGVKFKKFVIYSQY